MKWKNNLLASGLPLEHEAAEIADSLDFEITTDYTYSRYNEQGIQTDFSIDLLLKKSIYRDQKELLLCIPVECKYRLKDSTWLFMRDFIPEEEFLFCHMIVSEFSQSQQLRYGDSYAYFYSHHRTSKGVEVKGDSVFGKEIRHGIQQLKYALPKISVDMLLGQRLDHYIGDRLFMILPILLTTATVRILKSNFSIESVESLCTFDDIGLQLSNLLYIPSHSLDYILHCEKTIAGYGDYKIPRYFNDYDRSVKIKDIGDVLIDAVSKPLINVCCLDYFKVFLQFIINALCEDLEPISN